MLICSSTIE